MEAIQYHTRFDKELFDFAELLFDQRYKQLGESFTAEVQRFKQVNTAMNMVASLE